MVDTVNFSQPSHCLTYFFRFDRIVGAVTHSNLVIDNHRPSTAAWKRGSVRIVNTAVYHVQIVCDVQYVAEAEIGRVGGGDEIAEVNSADDVTEVWTLSQSVNVYVRLHTLAWIILCIRFLHLLKSELLWITRRYHITIGLEIPVQTMQTSLNSDIQTGCMEAKYRDSN
jgi:hypothetical protein